MSTSNHEHTSDAKCPACEAKARALSLANGDHVAITDTDGAIGMGTALETTTDGAVAINVMIEAIGRDIDAHSVLRANEVARLLSHARTELIPALFQLTEDSGHIEEPVMVSAFLHGMLARIIEDVALKHPEAVWPSASKPEAFELGQATRKQLVAASTLGAMLAAKAFEMHQPMVSSERRTNGVSITTIVSDTAKEHEEAKVVMSALARKPAGTA